ncbi:MAG: hypothetical protein WD906_06060 [Anaerolineales bacterium]
MIVLQWLVGGALLFLGRKLYWFFVGAVGFIVGLTLAAQWLQGRSELVILLVGILIGVVGAVLAMFLQRVALTLAGFLAGGYVALGLTGLAGGEALRVTLLPFLLGGAVGALLILFLFDWALILLSSLTGSSVIVQSLDLGPTLQVLLFLVLLAVGIASQASLMRRQAASPPSSPTPAA